MKQLFAIYHSFAKKQQINISLKCGTYFSSSSLQFKLPIYLVILYNKNKVCYITKILMYV